MRIRPGSRLHSWLRPSPRTISLSAFSVRKLRPAAVVAPAVGLNTVRRLQARHALLRIRNSAKAGHAACFSPGKVVPCAAGIPAAHGTTVVSGHRPCPLCLPLVCLRPRPFPIACRCAARGTVGGQARMQAAFRQRGGRDMKTALSRDSNCAAQSPARKLALGESFARHVRPANRRCQVDPESR